MVIMQKHLIAQRHWLIRTKYSREQWNKASKCLRGQKQMLHSHDGIDAAAVSLPHAPEPRLPTYIPNLCKNRTRGHYGSTGNQILYLWCISSALKSLYIWIQDNQSWGRRMICIDETYFYCYVAFGDFPHVEADCRDHVFIELTRLVQKKHADHFNHINKTNLLVKGGKS